MTIGERSCIFQRRRFEPYGFIPVAPTALGALFSNCIAFGFLFFVFSTGHQTVGKEQFRPLNADAFLHSCCFCFRFSGSPCHSNSPLLPEILPRGSPHPPPPPPPPPPPTLPRPPSSFIAFGSQQTCCCGSAKCRGFIGGRERERERERESSAEGNVSQAAQLTGEGMSGGAGSRSGHEEGRMWVEWVDGLKWGKKRARSNDGSRR